MGGDGFSLLHRYVVLQDVDVRLHPEAEDLHEDAADGFALLQILQHGRAFQRLRGKWDRLFYGYLVIVMRKHDGSVHLGKSHILTDQVIEALRFDFASFHREDAGSLALSCVI